MGGWDEKSVRRLPPYNVEQRTSRPHQPKEPYASVIAACSESSATETKREPVEETREREGVAIAAWIREAVDGAEPLIVYDRATDSYRSAKYGDIAILSNTRNPFPAFERALADLGIPFVKDGGREFFNGREVQDILAALRVRENPLDEVALLTMLRSPLFGWGDRDLARLRSTAGEKPLWYVLREFEPDDSTADRATYRKINQLRQEASVSPPVRLIELLCDVTAYRAALLCLPRGRAHVANIDKLIEFARATALLDGSSLTSFLNRATLAERYLSNETDAPAKNWRNTPAVASAIERDRSADSDASMAPMRIRRFALPLPKDWATTSSPDRRTAQRAVAMWPLTTRSRCSWRPEVGRGSGSVAARRSRSASECSPASRALPNSLSHAA